METKITKHCIERLNRTPYNINEIQELIKYGKRLTKDVLINTHKIKYKEGVEYIQIDKNIIIVKKNNKIITFLYAKNYELELQRRFI